MGEFWVLFVFIGVFCYITKVAESQFNLLRQSDYDVKLELARIESFNNSYMKYGKLDAVPYNRTYRVLNCSFEFLVDLNKQLIVGVETAKFLSNEYRFFPMNFEFDLCTEYTHDSFGIKNLFDDVSNIQPCFFKKGVHYHFYNTLPDFSKWPPHFPFGRYCIHFNIIHKSNRNSVIVAVVNVEIKAKPIKWGL